MTSPLRYTGNSGRRYTPTGIVGREFAAVRVVVHGGGLAYLPSLTFELRAADAAAYGVAIIEAAAITRLGSELAADATTSGELVAASNHRRYGAEATAAGRVALPVYDAEANRTLRSAEDTMSADTATAYGLALIEASVYAKVARAKHQPVAEVA